MKVYMGPQSLERTYYIIAQTGMSVHLSRIATSSRWGGSPVWTEPSSINSVGVLGCHTRTGMGSDIFNLAWGISCTTQEMAKPATAREGD